MPSFDRPLPIRELARGHCLSVANADRLIRDGEMLLSSGRFLSAINEFRLAVEELAKAHLMTQPSTLRSTDADKWKWFWSAFDDHREKLRIIENEFHWDRYQDKNEFNRRVSFLRTAREKSIYVDFDRSRNVFSSPEDYFVDAANLASLDHQYVTKIYAMFTLSGMPTVQTMEDVYDRYNRQFNGMPDHDE